MPLELVRSAAGGGAAIAPAPVVTATPAFLTRVADAVRTPDADVRIYGDSIFAGQGDTAEANAVAARLRARLHAAYDPTTVHGLGYFPATAPSDCWPAYWKHDPETTTAFGNAAPAGGECIQIPAGKRYRVQLPPSFVQNGRTYRTKRVEIIHTRLDGTTGYTYDVYPSAAQLTEADAFVAAGSGNSKTSGGLTGITGTVTVGAESGGQMGDTSGVLPITFDGATHSVNVQITAGSAGCLIEGLNLYGDDIGTGLRVHNCTRSGDHLYGKQWYDVGGGAVYAWFAHFGIPFGAFRGGAGAASPANRGALIVLNWAVNDLIFGPLEAPGYVQRLDSILRQQDASGIVVPILIALSYAPGGGADVWYTGYDAALGGFPPKTTYPEAILSVIKSISRRWGDRVGFVNVQAALGGGSYAENVAAKGWATPDAIHIKGGGAAAIAELVASAIASGVPSPPSPYTVVARETFTGAGPLGDADADIGGPYSGTLVVNRIGGSVGRFAGGGITRTFAPTIGDGVLTFRADYQGPYNGNGGFTHCRTADGNSEYILRFDWNGGGYSLAFYKVVAGQGVTLNQSVPVFPASTTVFVRYTKAGGAITVETSPNGTTGWATALALSDPSPLAPGLFGFRADQAWPDGAGVQVADVRFKVPN